MTGFLSALAGGMQVGQQMRSMRDTGHINRLAGQAYSAQEPEREALVGQMHQTNAGMAAEQDKALAMTDERRQKGLVNAARMLVNTPEQFRAGQYARMIPGLSRYGLSELPPEYNAETSGLIMETAQGLVKAADGMGGGGTIQSQKVSDDGYIVNTYRDGRMEKTGQKVDRQMWFRDHPGMEPQLVGKDGSVQQVGMPQPGASQIGTQMAPGRADMEADIQLANSMIAAGIPEAQVDAFLAQRGQRAPAAAPASHGAQPGGSLARPSVAQEAAATEAAKQQVQLQYLPQELAARGQAAVSQAVGIDDGKARAEAARDADLKARRMKSDGSSMLAIIKRVKDAPGRGLVTGLSGMLDPRARMRGGEASDFRADLQQLQGATFLQAFESLKGGGAITEIEGKKAEQAIAALNEEQSDEGFLRSLAVLEGVIATGIQKAEQDAVRAGNASTAGGPPAAATAPVQRARNPQTGQMVEFRNGQWVPVQ